MSTQVQQALISILSSLVLSAGAGLVTSGLITHDQLVAGAPTLAAMLLGGLLWGASIIYKIWPASADTKIALAKETGKVSRIVTTDEIANGPKFKTDPLVVSYSEAITTPPPLVKDIK